MYKYLHDADNRIVYKLPCEPEVREKMDRRGKRTGWSVRMHVDTTRADNVLNGSQWIHPTVLLPRQTFDAHYDRLQVITYFLMRNTPDGSSITEEEYLALQAKYEELACGN